MALEAHTRGIDGTIPIQAMLLDEEELWASQDNIGIYNGSRKSVQHQSGIVHITTHRLFFYSNTHTRKHSFEMPLSNVSSTEHYAGLMRSSPKVTLHLTAPAEDEAEIQGVGEAQWECGVCAYKNPSREKLCGLCGVPKDKSTPIPTPSTTPIPPSSTTVSCPACTFLNSLSSPTCEICETPLPSSASTPVSTSTSRSRTPIPDESFIKLSFRAGGDKPLYAVLKRALKSKAWQDHRNRPPTTTASTISSYGISGIMKTVETSAQDRDNNISGALQDLETLSVQARSMVSLAKDLNARLSSLPSSTSTSTLSSISTSEPEEAQFIRSSLSQLGLRSAPITDTTWLTGLADELTSILDTGIMKGRGIVGVDEVWGGWNRARGVSLIPPSTFLQIVPLLAPALKLRQMPQSHVQVLYTPQYDEDVFEKRLVHRLQQGEHGGKKRMWEIAMEEGVSVSLISEMVEASRKVVKDDDIGSGESWWCMNEFEDYEWDGHVFT